MTYELHQSLIGPQEKQPEHSQDLPATIEQIHYFENHLEMTAENINLIKGSQTIRHLRQIFHKAQMTVREIPMRSFLTKINYQLNHDS